MGALSQKEPEVPQNEPPDDSVRSAGWARGAIKFGLIAGVTYWLITYFLEDASFRNLATKRALLRLLLMAAVWVFVSGIYFYYSKGRKVRRE